MTAIGQSSEPKYLLSDLNSHYRRIHTAMPEHRQLLLLASMLHFIKASYGFKAFPVYLPFHRTGERDSQENNLRYFEENTA